MPSKGGGNDAALFAIDTTAHTVGALIYRFTNVETSSHTAQASGLHDFNLTDRAYDAVLAALKDAALPKDPSAGSAAPETLDPLEDGSGGGAVSQNATPYLLVYTGPYDADNDVYETITEIIRFDPSSFDLAATKGATTNRVNPKMIGQKPDGTYAVVAAKFAKVTAPATTNLTPTNLALDGATWWLPAI